MFPRNSIRFFRYVGSSTNQDSSVDIRDAGCTDLTGKVLSQASWQDETYPQSSAVKGAVTSRTGRSNSMPRYYALSGAPNSLCWTHAHVHVPRPRLAWARQLARSISFSCLSLTTRGASNTCSPCTGTLKGVERLELQSTYAQVRLDRVQIGLD